jgi:hypothetical protein
MREATIILPNRDNHGNPVDHAHHGLQHDLANKFGGFTYADVHGAWVNEKGTLVYDTSRAYTVALEHTGYTTMTLRTLAIRYGQQAGQDCVYVRYASGDVELVDTNELVEAVAA